MEFVEGENLGDMMDVTTDVELMQSYVAIAARVLSQIHGSHFESDDIKTHASEVKRLRRTAGLLTEMAPDFSRDVLLTLDRAEAAAKKIGLPKQVSMVHGGFKPTQMLVKGQHATLVDFDGAAVGDPAIDVGRFMAKLREDALDRNRRHLMTLPEHFLKAYAGASTREVVDRAPLFELNSLIRMSMRRFQTRPELLLDDDSSVAWNLLRLAQACLDRV
jgi:aminoglycoside phosphotransferase (APT) family kinase protein